MRRHAMLAVLVTAAIVASACTGGEKGSTSSPGRGPQRGGVLRIGLTSFGLSDNLDPTGEYTGGGWGVLWPMLRTLVAFKVASGAEGLQIVPDLATEVPTPSDDGLTYTFHLKPGIRFAPPVNREITSEDVAYAFERINTKSLAAQYGFYYDGVIDGMSGTAAKPGPISGIDTPDARTIVFHLTRPTGDFLARLTMPATAPVPPEVGGCFLKPGQYGRDIVASGPYMIEGSDRVDASACDAIQPVTGFDPTSQLTLVRNPNYDPSTDTQTGRMAYPDAIRWQVDTNATDIFDKIQTGELDLSWYDQPPKAVLRQYLTDPALKDRLKSISAGATEYFQMNLTAPPFDDIHVRKAVNYAIDRAAVQRAWGGPEVADIATHLIPSYVLGDVPAAHFDLYPSSGNEGDLTAAKDEMRQSRYDSNGDGICDAAACKDVVMINQNVEPWTTLEAIIVQDLSRIGIRVIARDLEFGAAFTAIQDPTAMIPSQIAVSWGYDYPDAYPYYSSLFDGSAINASTNLNFSMVGLTEAKAREIGVPYPSEPIPSVDAQIGKCEALTVGVERLTCWAELERTVMQDVVPIVPLVWYKLLVVTGNDVQYWMSTPQQGQALVNVAVSNKLSP